MSQSHLPVAPHNRQVRWDTRDTIQKGSREIIDSLSLFHLSLLRFFQSLSLSGSPPIKHWWSGKWRRVHCLATTLGIGFLSDRSARAWQRHLLCDDLSDNQYIRLPNLKHYQHFTLFTLITLNNLLFLVPHVYYKYQISVGKCLICILLLWFNEETNDC